MKRHTIIYDIHIFMSDPLHVCTYTHTHIDREKRTRTHSERERLLRTKQHCERRHYSLSSSHLILLSHAFIHTPNKLSTALLDSSQTQYQYYTRIERHTHTRARGRCTHNNAPSFAFTSIQQCRPSPSACAQKRLMVFVKKEEVVVDIAGWASCPSYFVCVCHSQINVRILYTTTISTTQYHTQRRHQSKAFCWKD